MCHAHSHSTLNYRPLEQFATLLANLSHLSDVTYFRGWLRWNAFLFVVYTYHSNSISSESLL